MDNKSLIEKADMALADLTAGGELLPAQAKKFIRLLILESVVMKMAMVRPMGSKKQRIEKIRFGSRILRAGQEATALSLADRAKPDLGKVELDAKLFKAEVHLDDEVLEDNIEQGNLRQTVMELMGEAIARDMDEILVRGDTGSADLFLSQFDGLLAGATSNVVAAGGVPLQKSVLKSMIKAMPTEFIRNKRRLRYLTSVDAETDWRDTLAERATAVGDKFLMNDAPTLYSSVPVMDVPLFPEDLGGGSNETNALLVDPKNLAVGIWRRIRMETDKDISAGVLKIVASMRFDFKYVEETAVVKATGITVS